MQRKYLRRSCPFLETSFSTAKVSALAARPSDLTDFRVVDPDGYYIRITGQTAEGPP